MQKLKRLQLIYKIIKLKEERKTMPYLSSDPQIWNIVLRAYDSLIFNAKRKLVNLNKNAKM